MGRQWKQQAKEEQSGTSWVGSFPAQQGELGPALQLLPSPPSRGDGSVQLRSQNLQDEGRPHRLRTGPHQEEVGLGGGQEERGEWGVQLVFIIIRSVQILYSSKIK